jgi:hypothetical protein
VKKINGLGLFQGARLNKKGLLFAAQPLAATNLPEKVVMSCE